MPQEIDGLLETRVPGEVIDWIARDSQFAGLAVDTAQSRSCGDDAFQARFVIGCHFTPPILCYRRYKYIVNID